MKMYKKIMAIGWVLSLFLLSAAFICYLSNENQIKKYDDKKYEINNFTAIGVTEPYISPYNNGNVYFEKGEYAKAIEQYKQALKYNIPEDKDCDIRVNIALAMVKPINIDDIDASNIDDVFDTLDEARDILCDNGCAENKKKGHDKDAQKLKNDIDEFEEKLRNMQDSASGGDGDGDDQQASNKNYGDLESQIKSGRDDAYAERADALMDGQQVWDSNNIFGYDGDNW